MEQRIYFDENDKLVVITDNGKISDGNTTSQIKGKFSINAEDLTKIFIPEYNIKVNMRKYISEFNNPYNSHFSTIFLSDEDILKEFKDKEDEIKKLKIEIAKLEIKLRDERRNYSLKIDKHNSKWWRRKIK